MDDIEDNTDKTIIGASFFSIEKTDLSERQIHKIHTHIERAAKYNTKDKYKNFDFGCVEEQYAWKITEDDFEIKGETDADYFDMYRFLMAINVDPLIITWTGH